MLKLLLLVAFIHNIIYVSSSKHECPPDTYPCSCKSNYDKILKLQTTVVTCDHPTSADKLPSILAEYKGLKDLHIRIHGAVDKIPSDLFKGLDVYKLEFTDNFNLERIGDEGRSSFEGLEDTLKELHIIEFEEPLKYINLSSLNIIDTLIIERTRLTALEDELFKNGPISLKHLEIWGCKFKEIGDKAFEKLVNLEILVLIADGISDIRRSMFPNPANYLEDISLARNNLSSLPDDIFSNMPSLRLLDLAYNRITRLPEATWSTVWSQLDLAWIDENPLICDSHIEWMFRTRSPKDLFARCAAPEHYKNEVLQDIVERNLKRQ